MAESTTRRALATVLAVVVIGLGAASAGVIALDPVFQQFVTDHAKAIASVSVLLSSVVVAASVLWVEGSEARAENKAKKAADATFSEKYKVDVVAERQVGRDEVFKEARAIGVAFNTLGSNGKVLAVILPKAIAETLDATAPLPPTQPLPIGAEKKDA